MAIIKTQASREQKLDCALRRGHPLKPDPWVLLFMIGAILTMGQVQGSIEIKRLEDSQGYIVLQRGKIEIVTETEIALHIVNTKDIVETLGILTENIKHLKGPDVELLEKETRELKSKLQTIVDVRSRKKRGLIDIVGHTEKFLFGTMDSKDREDIRTHLSTLDEKVNSDTANLNQQIRINNLFNDTLNKLRNTIIADRNTIQNQLNYRDDATINLLAKNTFLLQISLLKSRIEQIQDNIFLAHHGLLHTNILSEEEIHHYKIDIRVLENLRTGVFSHNNNTLIFAVKMPIQFQTVPIQMIVPALNKDNKEILAPIETIIVFENQTFEYIEKRNILNEMSLSRHCTVIGKCDLVYNTNTEIKELTDDTILAKNLKSEILTQNCESSNVVLTGQYLIHYNNCSFDILHHHFNSRHTQFLTEFVHFHQDNITFQDKLTFDDIVFKQEENLKEITNLQVHATVNYSIVVLLALVISAVVIVLIILNRKQNFTVNVKN